MEGIKVLLITQARRGSSRLPSKVLLKVKGDELLKIHLTRLKKSKLVDQIIVATTINAEDDFIQNLCMEWGYQVGRGSVDDVLDRYYQIAKVIKPEWVVRVTSDCPLLDPTLIDAVISLALVNEVDYCSNVIVENFPDGQDIEVFKFSALEKTWKEAKLKSEREHVTTYMRSNRNNEGEEIFHTLNFPCAYDFSGVRMTVDEPQDFELIENLIEDLGLDCSWLTYTNCILEKYPHINNNLIRNEGLIKSMKND